MQPWYEIDFKNERSFNTVVVAEEKANITGYTLDYWNGISLLPLFDGCNGERIKLHRFGRVWASKVRMQIRAYDHQPFLADFQMFDEHCKD
jgi:alpha-L-fucosidase